MPCPHLIITIDTDTGNKKFECKYYIDKIKCENCLRDYLEHKGYIRG